jgi:hypothetical protein
MAIEFNGDYWHMNPKLYEQTDINPSTKKSSLEQWSLDNEKVKLCENNNIKLIVIWESDWLKHKEQIKENILSQLR